MMSHGFTHSMKNRYVCHYLAIRHLKRRAILLGCPDLWWTLYPSAPKNLTLRDWKMRGVGSIVQNCPDLTPSSNERDSVVQTLFFSFPCLIFVRLLDIFYGENTNETQYTLSINQVVRRIIQKQLLLLPLSSHESEMAVDSSITSQKQRHYCLCPIQMITISLQMKMENRSNGQCFFSCPYFLIRNNWLI